MNAKRKINKKIPEKFLIILNISKKVKKNNKKSKKAIKNKKKPKN